MKDTYAEKSLFSKIKKATDVGNYDEVSTLQIELEEKMKELRELYSAYRKNLLDI